MKKGIIAGVTLLLITHAFAQTDSSKTNPSANVLIKPYKEVVTNKAITEKGLFKIHKIDDRYFFEIPDSLINRDIMIVNRISKAPAMKAFLTMYGLTGDEIGENVIQFTKGPNNKLFLKTISYTEVSKDSSADGMYRSVTSSNLQPIEAAFDIKAFGADSAVVVDFTDYISNDNGIFFFDKGWRDMLKISAFQPDKSYVENVKPFPENVEIHTIKTFSSTDIVQLLPPDYPVPVGNKTFELNSSIVLLPKIPMQPRYADERVGYFSTGFVDFDANPQGIAITKMITRWRLEPKPDDIDKYMKGELVEPQKPIIFYIDPATPRKWVPYLIQGVNDWQKAFEKAGFKHAIYALEAPTNDSVWGLEDARHNAIIYKPSTVTNAYGPQVHDPRSGEILETHVQWFHNVMQLVHDWYMIQAGAIDPRARKMEFDDSLMGQLIRFVSSHEIGHTLGLTHNLGASSTVSVDSLRNKQWVEANGHTPSIMDYARFNYVAQPEDSISEKGIFPRIGVYDEWAIEWGYRLLPLFKTRASERAYFNNWYIKRLNENKHIWYGRQDVFNYPDPRRQEEDLGDDDIKASTYGIKNLKRIISQLPEWTKEPNEDYNDLRRMYNQVLAQHLRYIGHVVSYIGGVMQAPKMMNQEGSEVAYVPKAKQKEAVHFLIDQFFIEPYWLINQPYVLSLGMGATLSLDVDRQSVLETITSNFTFLRLKKWEGLQPTACYTVKELLTDLKEGIFKELKTGKSISRGQRLIQKIYVKRLIDLSKPEAPKGADMIEAILHNHNAFNDISSIAKGLLNDIQKEIKKDLLIRHDEMTTLHLQDLLDRVNLAKNSSSGNDQLRAEQSNNQAIDLLLNNGVKELSPHFLLQFEY